MATKPARIWTVAERVVRAKIQMRRTYPFFSHICIWLDPVQIEEDDMCIGASCAGVTREGTMYYRPEVFATYSDDTIRSILVHEVMHPAFGTFLREGARDKKLWNAATDVKINDIMDDEGLCAALPEGMLKPKKHGITVGRLYISNINEKSSEQIYHELITNREKLGEDLNEQSWECHIWAEDGQPDEKEGGDQPGKGGGIPGDKVDEGDVKGTGVDLDSKLRKQADKWLKRVQSAVTHCEMQKGHVPGGVGELLKRMTDPGIDWRTYIEQFVERSIISDFSYRRPRKTYYDNGIYLPSVIRESMELVYHIDTSGSMSTQQLERALGGLYALLAAHPAITAHVVICDAAIHNVYKITSEDSENLVDKIQMGGRGGTSHRPVVDWINENLPEVAVFVSFTDGCSDIPQCYGDLPQHCTKLLCLTDGYGGRQSELAKFAEIVTMGDSG